jgi:precorrin-2/cobalt-factor-2 C20-methyltransferase
MNDFGTALNGHFYAIGVGPGAADLLTVRAVNLIRGAHTIIAPRSERADESQSRLAIAPYLNGQEVIDHAYPMRRDEEATMRCWQAMADVIVARCRAGQAVVQITLGDPLLYSTSCYLIDLVRAALSDAQVHVVPGISAFQAAACRFAEPITLQEDRLVLMSATDLDAVERALDECETLVLYKCGKKLADLVRLFERRGLAGQLRVACYVEQDGRQALLTDPQAIAAYDSGYMATMIVHVSRRKWQAPA